MSIEFDPGPPAAWAALFSQVPDYSAYKAHFWFDWGPIFYRGRLDGSAKVLVVASDPGPTERIAGRTLVGDAGQRVQGFLAKLGLTRSYLCLNAFVYALIPSEASHGTAVLKDAQQAQWRNGLYDEANGASVQAIIAFGDQAQRAVSLWPGKGARPLFNLPHPTSHDPAALINAWRAAVPQLRAIVTADPDGNPGLPNYGAAFAEADYQPIPRFDLPYGVPAFLGDDAWVRRTPGMNSSVSRPNPDDRHTLIWKARTS
jgi:Uracil DNA glycosylase superfamily